MHLERRGNKRFKTIGSAIAIVHSGLIIPCSIEDISREGLAVFYLGKDGLLRFSFEVEIVLRNKSFSLEKIPVKTVSDLLVPDLLITKRRCGMLFGELKHDQASKLDYFIQNHTMVKPSMASDGAQILRPKLEETKSPHPNSLH